MATCMPHPYGQKLIVRGVLFGIGLGGTTLAMDVIDAWLRPERTWNYFSLALATLLGSAGFATYVGYYHFNRRRRRKHIIRERKGGHY